MKPSSSDGLPSYSELVGDSPLPLSPFEQSSQNRSAAQTVIINDAISNHITPHWHTNALSGLSQSTLILVPCNVSDLIESVDAKDPQSTPDGFPGEVVVGFPTSENLSVVRLRNGEHTVEFWRQESAIEELERRLCEMLQRDRLKVFVRAPPDSQWRHAQEKALAQGEARVGAEMRHVCLRIENQLGLYETRTGRALVVRVEFGIRVSRDRMVGVGDLYRDGEYSGYG